MKKLNGKLVWGTRFPRAMKFLMIMKLTAVFLMISFLGTFAAESYSQNKKITLDLKQTTVEEALSKIEDQSEFYFFLYSEKIIDVNRKISLDIKEQTIDKVLNTLFAGTDVTYKIKDRIIVLSTPEIMEENFDSDFFWQQKTVQGLVTNAEGEPLPGVTVVIKGTTRGTITNADGEYNLSAVPEDATLSFSFVGMSTQEVIVGTQTRIDITMEEETIGMDEVVVVGYGTQKKSHLTAAVDQIEGEVLDNRPLRSVADGLQGMVAGLNVRAPSGAPEATPNLNIRGFTGFGSTEQPLVLVDGVEREISTINPNDIASVSVLKDGAASAIYGSRAPFGVVLITTKSGEKGEDMKINYSANMRYGQPFMLPEIQDSYKWAKMMNEAYRNHPGGGRAAPFNELQVQRMEAFAAGDFDNAVFDGLNPEHVPYGTFAISPTQWGKHWDTFANTDWIDIAMLDIVPSQQHNIGVSGGGENTSYYAGLGYNESVGIFDGPNYKKRYTALVKIDTEITNWLDFNLSTNYVKTDEKGPNYRGAGRNYGTFFNNTARAHPHRNTINPNGSYGRFNHLPGILGEDGTEKYDQNRIILSGGFTFKPFKDFYLKGKYTWRNTTSNYDRNTLQSFQILPNGTVATTQRTERQTSIVKSYDNADYHTIDLHASYTKTLNGVHNFFALAGYQEEENYYTRLRGSATDFYSPSVPTISTSAANFQTSDRITDWATRGFFGRFSYNYDEKYFLEFNARRDATSRFLADDRWGFFPSVSAAWNVAREDFWPLEDLVSQFKPRGSWSTSGNANVGLYPFYPSINTSLSNTIILGGDLVSTASMPGLVSDQLTWAKPTTFDVGFDLIALNNRLEVNYDWYQRTVRDQFGPPPSLPESLGTSVPNSNNAVSETRGWEIKLSWRDKALDLLGKPVNYQLQFRMSDYIGYVVEYEDDGTGSRSGQWTPGEVFGQNYYYSSNGIMQNAEELYANPIQGGTWYYPGDLAMKDLNGDGEINSGTIGTWYSMGDIQKNGFNYPRKSYGISMKLDWNNFDVSFLLDGVMQWTRYSGNMYVWGTSGSIWFAPYYEQHADLGYWSPDNTNAFYPRNTLSGKNRGRANDQYLLDLSHLRVRNLQIGYNIPRVLLQKFKLDRIRLYVSGENLGFIYYNSFIKYDPELIAASSGQGYPPQRYFSFGVNVTF